MIASGYKIEVFQKLNGKVAWTITKPDGTTEGACFFTSLDDNWGTWNLSNEHKTVAQAMESAAEALGRIAAREAHDALVAEWVEVRASLEVTT